MHRLSISFTSNDRLIVVHQSSSTLIGSDTFPVRECIPIEKKKMGISINEKSISVT
jgi:hypothetical protein